MVTHHSNTQIQLRTTLFTCVLGQTATNMKFEQWTLMDVYWHQCTGWPLSNPHRIPWLFYNFSGYFSYIQVAVDITAVPPENVTKTSSHSRLSYSTITKLAANPMVPAHLGSLCAVLCCAVLCCAALRCAALRCACVRACVRVCVCVCVCVCSLTNLQFPDFSTFSRLVATLLCTERNRRMQCAKCRKKDPSVLMSESPRADRGGGVLAPAGSRVEAGPLKDFCVHWGLQAAYSATLLRVNSCRNSSIWQQRRLCQPPRG